MKASNLLKAASLLVTLTCSATLVQAEYAKTSQSTSFDNRNDYQKDYQEVTYDELLNQIDAKKSHLIRETSKSPFDTVMIHAGLGYVNSFSNFRANNQSLNRYQNGLQISLGIDLFSPNWFSEGVFRNYGTSSQGLEDINLKEFDLKVGYQAPVSKLWAYSMSTGLANRFLRITDPSTGMDINDTTPSLILSGGFFATPSKNVSLGIEINARSPLVSSTADKDSFDFALRVTTSL